MKTLKIISLVLNIVVLIFTSLFIISCIYISYYPKTDLALCTILFLYSLEDILNTYINKKNE